MAKLAGSLQPFQLNLLMRRNYQHFQQPQKPFITSYHINEVPLPYYNPLQDPYLSGFFSNRKVSQHIHDMGLIYSPKKQYPYAERRAKNAHKYLKDNLCKVPPDHLLKHKDFESSSCMVGSQQLQLLPHEKEDKFFRSMPKRKAGSEIINRTGNKFTNISELLSKRPLTNNNKLRGHSPQIRSKSHIFHRRNLSASKRQNAEQDALA